MRTTGMRHFPLASLLVTLALAACDPALPSAPAADAGPSAEALTSSRTVSGPTDPTVSFGFPLDATGLAVKSDGLYGDGTNSIYDNGVCNVSAKIFATTQYSNSGDATMQSSNRRSCTRTLSWSYGDGLTEQGTVLLNLNQVESSTYAIPSGQTVSRRFVLNPTVLGRCDKLIYGVAGSSDSVLVTRVNASTWSVQTAAYPNDRAYCDTNGLSYHMPLRFVLVSHTALP